jgi:hypothetical protein
MQLRSYLVPAGQAERLWRWLRGQAFDGGSMLTGYEGLEEAFAGDDPWGIPARRRLDLIEAEHRGSGSAPAPMTATANTMSLTFSDDAYQGGSLHWPVRARVFFADALRWDGGSGFVDAHGVRVFFAPSLTEAGPSALLVDRGWMDHFLARYQLSLFWTVLAELNVVAGRMGHHDLGYSIHSRAHRLADGRVMSSRGKTQRHGA